MSEAGPYDHSADGMASYYAAIAGMRERHLEMLEKLLPRLRRERYRQKLTQRQLASDIGVCRSAVQQWESGDLIPGADHLRLWRARLGV